MEPKLERRTTNPLSAEIGGQGFGAFRAAVLAGCLVLIHLLVSPVAWAGANVDLTQATGGIALTAVGNNYTSSFGTLDGLGINTGAIGVTAIPVGNGTWYVTQYGVFAHGGLAAGQTASVTAYISTNFAQPVAMLIESCPSSTTCTTQANFTPMSTVAGAPTTVATGVCKTCTQTAGLAIFVPDNNGATAFTGSTSAVISFTATNDQTATVIETFTLSLNNPNETLQSAVRLTLSTGTAATAHCAFTPGGGAPDYTLSFGNVDGLGINAGSCGTEFAPAVQGTNNAFYWTDYNLTPSFTDQNPFASSNITAQVTANFATTNIFVVRDAANSATVPTTAAQLTPMGVASADTIASGLTNRTAITRFIGIGVTPANGAGLAGAKSATVTFTLTVM